MAPVHRLSAQPLQVATPFGATPTRIVGQASLKAVESSTNPNLVEGKEMWQPSAVALDLSVSPPALYVSDPGNNRVLGWQNAASFLNGAAADIVVGQRDLFTTNPAGPGTTLKRGLNYPTGLAVDGQGNLYVVDAGNNRILRYPKPFADVQNRTSPDLWIGQADPDNYRSANRGGAVGSDGISTPTVADGHIVVHSLVFDVNGNLWFTDTGNHRVLCYLKVADGKVKVTPDIVLGQQSLTTALSATGMQDKLGLRYPVGVTLDPAGRIYVADGLYRVLVYPSNPLAAGTAALRLLGLLRVTTPRPNDTEFGLPMGLVMVGDKLGVMDAGWNRVLFFDPYLSWPADSPTSSSPAAKSVLGQANLTTNKGKAGSTGLRAPAYAAYSGSELFVADFGNNRVVVFPPGFVSASLGATRVLGQLGFDWFAPNLIEGRELYVYSGYYTSGGANFVDTGGVVVDATSNPPHLYISDTYNHRVLGFRDARNVRPGDTADLVLGQPDGKSSAINGQANDPTQLNDTGLYVPAGLAVDGVGNLYVADRGNGRVLRFPKPFEQPSLFAQHPNLVLGQRSFTEKNTDASQFNMSAPYGLAIMPEEGHLLVSDRTHNRVLIFKKQGGDFNNGMAAAAVFGQPDFNSTGSVQGSFKRMVSPRGIAVDGNGRLYVADTGNNRVLVYSGISGVQPDSDPDPLPSPIIYSTGTTPLKSPSWVYVKTTGMGEIWVAEFWGGRVLRYPDYSVTQLTGVADFQLFTVTAPLAVTLDGFGNPVVLESASRVSFYFPPLWTTNSANYLPDSKFPITYNQPCCAPGSLATVWPFSPSGSFGAIDGAHAPRVPLDITLSDVQVLIDGTPAPLLDVRDTQINFQMPKRTPTSGNVDILVVRPSTGQILAAGSIAMRSVSPALLMNPGFFSGATGKTLVVAQNNGDSPVSCNGIAGTPYNPVNCPGGVRPARRGEVVTLYCNGQGLVGGMPEDGFVSSGQPTADNPEVLLAVGAGTSATVHFSGLAPELVGVWQINFTVPDTAAPGLVAIALRYHDVTSSWQGIPSTVILVQ